MNYALLIINSTFASSSFVGYQVFSSLRFQVLRWKKQPYYWRRNIYHLI